MKVKVRFLANMAIFMEIKEITVNFDNKENVTVGDVIRKVTDTTGKDLKGKVMNEKGESTGRVRIIIKGRDIVSLERFQTKVSENDEVSMFPALGAG